MINFNVNRTENRIIDKIVDRALDVLKKSKVKLGPTNNRLALEMDVVACHLNGNPLKLEELLTAHNLDFVHDVFGIVRHSNRKTGKLEDCFSPRYSDTEVKCKN